MRLSLFIKELLAYVLCCLTETPVPERSVLCAKCNGCYRADDRQQRSICRRVGDLNWLLNNNNNNNLPLIWLRQTAQPYTCYTTNNSLPRRTATIYMAHSRRKFWSVHVSQTFCCYRVRTHVLVTSLAVWLELYVQVICRRPELMHTPVPVCMYKPNSRVQYPRNAVHRLVQRSTNISFTRNYTAGTKHRTSQLVAGGFYRAACNADAV